MCKEGTPDSYRLLLRSTKALSNRELAALEDDLEYYAKTGLIGVTMSQLLVQLQPEQPSKAA